MEPSARVSPQQAESISGRSRPPPAPLWLPAGGPGAPTAAAAAEDEDEDEGATAEPLILTRSPAEALRGGCWKGVGWQISPAVCPRDRL